MIICFGPGRFSNKFFRNTFGYLLAKRFGFGVQMEEGEAFKEIGLPYDNDYRVPHSSTKLLEENECVDFLNSNINPNVNNNIINTTSIHTISTAQDNIINTTSIHTNISTNINFNINLDHCFCQSREFALYMLNNFYGTLFNNTMEEMIRSVNPYRERYGNNDDIFIHYRIGDLVELNMLNPHEYYETTLNKILTYNNSTAEKNNETTTTTNQHNPTTNNRKIYVSSDSPTHPFIQSLIQKYNATLFDSDSISQLILFSSTCKHLILSLGTLSWLIGLYGFASEKYFLNPLQVRYWHGCIFQPTQYEEHINKDKWHMQSIKLENLPVNKSLYWSKEQYELKQYTFPSTSICFIHLPRTGGSTLKSYIKSNFFTVNRSPVSFLCPSKEFKYITIFREPVSRVWAFFNMIKRQGKNYPYKEMTGTMKNFCLNCWEASNCYTKLLAGETVEHNLPDAELLRRAKENMKNFFYILDFNQLEKDINALRIKIVKELPETSVDTTIQHVQYMKYDRNISSLFRKVIEEHNKLDIELYQYYLTQPYMQF